MYQSALNRARSDKFILVLNLPQILKQQYDSTLNENFKVDTLQFSIYGSPVPQINVPAIDLPYGGQVYKASSLSRPAYDPLNIKFLIDNGYKNYYTIWKWLNLFNDAKKSGTLLTNSIDASFSRNDPSLINPMAKFTSTFTIYGLDEYNNKVISFEYNHAFPTNLSEINFSNQEPAEITSSVTFVFNQLNVELLKNVDQINC